MGLTPISGRITLRTERDGVCTGERTSQNIMCNGGLGELASALAWSAAQDQGSLIGAVANYMTPFYGAVGSGAYPPFSINGAINSGSTQVTQVSPNQVTFTGNVTSGSNSVTSVSSTTGIFVGMTLSDTLGYIPPGAQVTAIVGSTLTLSANATNSATTETINGYYPLSPGMIIEATSGIPLYTTISSYSPSTNTVTMSKAATGDTMNNAVALDIVTTGTTSVTSSSSTAITTIAGEMLIVIVGSYNGTTANLSISDTLGTLTWTKIQGSNGTSFAAPAIFWAIASTATSGKVTVTNTGTSTLVMQPWQVSKQGYFGPAGSPIFQTINATSYAANFPNPPNANSLVITVFEEANASTPTITQPNGFTSMMATSSGRVYLQAAQMNGLAYQNIMWAESGVTAAPALLAIEIQPASSTAMNVGTSATDLTLYNELGRAQVSAVTSSPPGSSGTANTFYQFQFEAQTATFTLTEAGVFANASSTVGTGSLLDHALFIPQFTWTAGDTLTMTAEFTWSNPT